MNEITRTPRETNGTEPRHLPPPANPAAYLASCVVDGVSVRGLETLPFERLEAELCQLAAQSAVQPCASCGLAAWSITTAKSGC